MLSAMPQGTLGIGAVFDFDGTLADTTWMLPAVGERIFRERGKRYDGEWLFATQHMDAAGIAAWAKNRYGVRGTVDELARAIEDGVHELYTAGIHAKPGARAFLRTLKREGVPTCVATATGREDVEPALERIGLASLVDAIVTCPEVGASKREPVIYRAAAELMGTSLSHTVVFEDMLFAARTAKAAGCYLIAVEDEVSLPHRAALQDLADDYISTFEDADRSGSFWRRAVASIGGGVRGDQLSCTAGSSKGTEGTIWMSSLAFLVGYRV